MGVITAMVIIMKITGIQLIAMTFYGRIPDDNIIIGCCITIIINDRNIF